MKPMAWERKFGAVCLLILILAVCVGPATAQDEGKEKAGSMDVRVLIAFASLMAVIIALILTKYLSKKKKLGDLDAEEEHKIRGWKKCEKLYKEALRRELGHIGVIGPGFERIDTRIEETFTSLHISQYNPEGSLHCVSVEPGKEKTPAREAVPRMGEMVLSPKEIMAQAFPKYRVLLLVGDPGAGKTTLLKYYSITCLDKKHRDLGFQVKKLLPMYFPLRDLVFDGNIPISLYKNLEVRADKRHLDIPAAVFKYWVENRPTLILLDGLDEISDLEKRRQVCRWVGRMETGLEKAQFVLTSRPTGYRKSDDVELDCPHLRGEIMDFTQDQQAHFLDRWFQAVYLDELPGTATKRDKEIKAGEALDRAGKITAFLNKEENKSVRELARVPMLLQIMAIIWKSRDFLPETRRELYDESLKYLLEYRDRRRDLKPLLPVDNARKALMPAALWMQETLRSDNAAKEKIHETMQPLLNTFTGQPGAQEFCENLRDRAGVIADYGTNHYIFRHKSFMEYLAALQLVKEATHKPSRLENPVEYFPDPWWEETLRFFIGNSDELIFDRLMLRFFQSDVSLELDARQQTLLQLLVKEAPQKKVDSLVKGLHAGNKTDKQRRYMIECLKTIGTPEALAGLQAFIDKNKQEESGVGSVESVGNVGLARDVVAELSTTPGDYVTEILPGSLRNPFEDNVEYIKIPGGTYKFSVTEKMETVPEIYFCKYLVTNKRYRKFIAYLEGKEKTLEGALPLKVFSEKLLELAGTIKDYPGYIGVNPREWGEKLRSPLDEDKKFNGDDQPVVGVSWYAARTYCLWQSCLHKQKMIYRLPTEVEWEWAAAGREPDGSLREYPWGKGKPTPKLANYGGNVGTTTPVGRYPEGATPEGLMDMAGNAWEWMDNWIDEDKKYRALRGGSWNVRSDYLPCSARYGGNPWNNWHGVGFRVVCVCSPGHTAR